MQPVREVYSLLMPVKGGRIIVPRAAVAEVMGYSKPKDRPDDAPAFVLGFVDWQNQRIPLVSFEAARGGDVPELGRRTRIAVVFGIADRLRPNVFAVVTQGYPYLVRVNENVLHREDTESDDPLVLARVRMANEKPFIPNLEQLEILIAEGLGIEAEASRDEAAGPVDELDALALGDEEDFDATVLGDTGEADDDADETSFDVDLGGVTVVGETTQFSTELDDLSSALDDEESKTPDIDFGEVTSVGTDTSYSTELDELSGALQDDSEELSNADDDYAIDLSGIDLGDDGGEESGPSAEFDLSDLEIDLDEDEKKGD